MSNIVVPELGESVVEARVARWLKKEGDRIEIGDPLVELETEKVDLEVNADKGGVLASIARREGEDVKIGELLGVVDEAASAAASLPPEGGSHVIAEKSGNGSSGNGSTAAPAKAPAPSATPAAQVDTRATPTARRIAREHDVDLGSVPGSGSAGRVMKQDVHGALGAKGASSAEGASARTPGTLGTPGTSGTLRSER